MTLEELNALFDLRAELEELTEKSSPRALLFRG